LVSWATLSWGDKSASGGYRSLQAAENLRSNMERNSIHYSVMLVPPTSLVNGTGVL